MHSAGIFVVGLIVLSLFALWVYALVSAIKNERLDPNLRIVWVLVIILVNGLGALLYLIVAPNRPTADEIRIANAMRRRDELQRAARRS